MPQTKTIESGPFYRVMHVRQVDEDERTVELSFSSEEPVERFFGLEILGHGNGEVDLSRLNTAGPVLVDHDWRDQVGVVEEASIRNRRGRVIARFGRSERASEVFQDIVDGIRQNVSVGYRVLRMVLEEEDDDKPTYRVTRWEPFEVSIVSVAADISVGVGRSGEEEANTIVIETRGADMPKEKEKETPAVTDENRQPENQPTREREREREPERQPESRERHVDVREVEDRARRQEQDRVRSILTIGERHGATELARQFVENGKGEDDFRQALLEKMADGKLKRVDASPETGLSDQETRRFSFLRAINALANPTSKRAQEAAAFEFECSQATAEKLNREAEGILVPQEVLTQPLRAAGQRDLTAGTPADGGNLVATDLLAGSFIDLLRNRMVVGQLATRLNDLVGNIAIPRQTGGATAYWVAESGDPTESQPAFDQVAMTPKTVGAFTDISRKLLIQSSVDVEAFVRRDLATVIALELDRVAINGSGAGNEPEGILNTTGVTNVPLGTDGAAPDWASIVQLETEIAADNADIGSLAYVTNARARGTLKTTEKASGTAQFIWGDNMVNGYDARVTNQVPSNLSKGTGSNLSAMLFGNWADLLMGLWSGLDLTVDPYTQATSGTIRVVVLQDADLAVRHAESFSMINDMVTG